MRPLLKLCGLHSLADVRAAARSEADYLGFIFADSRRRVSHEMVSQWLSSVDIQNKKTVALFVNESLEGINAALKGLNVDVIQCHGTESPTFLNEVKTSFNVNVWKVIHHGEGSLTKMKSYAGIADGYVIDRKHRGKWGGTGHSFDWSQVPAYLHEGMSQGVPVFIAGGIRPDNISELLRYSPDGVDVSSGVEQEGKKSAMLITELEERMK